MILTLGAAWIQPEAVSRTLVSSYKWHMIVEGSLHWTPLRQRVAENGNYLSLTLVGCRPRSFVLALPRTDCLPSGLIRQERVLKVG